MKKRRVG